MSTRPVPPAQRRAFILEYLAQNPPAVTVVDQEFVDAYVAATRAKSMTHIIGAPSCAMLGEDLRRLHREGDLERRRVGLSGMGPGWPTWVWSYTLPATP